MAYLFGKEAINFMKTNPVGTWKPVGSSTKLKIQTAGDQGLLGNLLNGLVAPVGGAIDLVNTGLGSDNNYTSSEKRAAIEKNPLLETGKVAAGIGSYFVPGGIATGTLGKVGGMAAAGALGGGLLGFSGSKQGEELQGTATGALLGGGIGGGLGVASNVLGKIKGSATKGLGLTEGTPGKALEDLQKTSNENVAVSVANELKIPKANTAMNIGTIQDFSDIAGVDLKRKGLPALKSAVDPVLTKSQEALDGFLANVSSAGVQVNRSDIAQPLIDLLKSTPLPKDQAVVKGMMSNVLGIDVSKMSIDEIANAVKTLPPMSFSEASNLATGLNKTVTGIGFEKAAQGAENTISRDAYLSGWQATKGAMDKSLIEGMGTGVSNNFNKINNVYSTGISMQELIKLSETNGKVGGIQFPTPARITKWIENNPSVRRTESRVLDGTIKFLGKNAPKVQSAKAFVMTATKPSEQVAQSVNYLKQYLTPANTSKVARQSLLGKQQ